MFSFFHPVFLYLRLPPSFLSVAPAFLLSVVFSSRCQAPPSLAYAINQARLTDRDSLSSLLPSTSPPLTPSFFRDHRNADLSLFFLLADTTLPFPPPLLLALKNTSLVDSLIDFTDRSIETTYTPPPPPSSLFGRAIDQKDLFPSLINTPDTIPASPFCFSSLSLPPSLKTVFFWYSR